MLPLFPYEKNGQEHVLQSRNAIIAFRSGNFFVSACPQREENRPISIFVDSAEIVCWNAAILSWLHFVTRE